MIDKFLYSFEAFKRFANLRNTYINMIVYLNVLMKKEGKVDLEKYFKNRFEHKPKVLLDIGVTLPKEKYILLNNFYALESEILFNKTKKFGRKLVKIMFLNFIKIILCLIILLAVFSQLTKHWH